MQSEVILSTGKRLKMATFSNDKHLNYNYFKSFYQKMIGLNNLRIVYNFKNMLINKYGYISILLLMKLYLKIKILFDLNILILLIHQKI